MDLDDHKDKSYKGKLLTDPGMGFLSLVYKNRTWKRMLIVMMDEVFI